MRAKIQFRIKAFKAKTESGIFAPKNNDFNQNKKGKRQEYPANTGKGPHIP